MHGEIACETMITAQLSEKHNATESINGNNSNTAQEVKVNCRTCKDSYMQKYKPYAHIHATIDKFLYKWGKVISFTRMVHNLIT